MTVNAILLTATLAVAPQGQGGGAQTTFGAAAPAAPVRDAATEKKGTGVIRGRVVTADGGKPMRRVQISIASPDLSAPRSVSTNLQGLFELRDLPEGRYTVSDYVDTPVEARSGQKLEGVTIVITNKLPTVRGVLQDEKGLPANGTVMLFPEDASKWSEGSRLVRAGRPDPAGAFEIPLVPAGEYLIAAADYVPIGAWEDPQFLEGLRDGARKVAVTETGTPSIALTLQKR